MPHRPAISTLGDLYSALDWRYSVPVSTSLFAVRSVPQNGRTVMLSLRYGF